MLPIIYSLIDNAEYSRTGNEGDKGTSRLAIKILLLSLSMLFGASLAGYFWVRGPVVIHWKPADMPTMPFGLWYSTCIVICISFSFESAILFLKKGKAHAFQYNLFGIAILAFSFLTAQFFNWKEMSDKNMLPTTQNLYSFTFYFLTTLHAVHVVGGILVFPKILIRALSMRYAAGNYGEIRNFAYYWHFLGAVWIVLFFIFRFFSAS